MRVGLYALDETSRNTEISIENQEIGDTPGVEGGRRLGVQQSSGIPGRRSDRG